MKTPYPAVHRIGRSSYSPPQTFWLSSISVRSPFIKVASGGIYRYHQGKIKDTQAKQRSLPQTFSCHRTDRTDRSCALSPAAAKGRKAYPPPPYQSTQRIGLWAPSSHKGIQSGLQKPGKILFRALPGSNFPKSDSFSFSTQRWNAGAKDTPLSGKGQGHSCLLLLPQPFYRFLFRGIDHAGESETLPRHQSGKPTRQLLCPQGKKSSAHRCPSSGRKGCGILGSMAAAWLRRALSAAS